MNFLAEVRHRFRPALERLAPDATRLLEMIRTSQNPRHGDYQVNCALPLEKTLGRPAREIAAELLGGVELSDLGDAEVAGPGFVNLRLAAAPLAEALRVAILDERLGVRRVDPPRTFVVDFSSPNVAKTMHVGHIRSTVIGDALSRILRFVGHRVITDNHLGDWGTQFGMILYGFKHLADAGRYAAQPVEELNRLYRRVRQIGEYQEAVEQLPAARRDLERDEATRRQLPATDPTIPAAESRIAELRARVTELAQRVERAESDPTLVADSVRHPQIEARVLDETARLHAGDPENRRLWREFLPHCLEDVHAIYRRLNVTFDHELGESFYHDQLAATVESFQKRGLARESDGAMCVFLDGFETPMIIRKKDGAYLYSTSDLATIEYRARQWHPDAILYVVDHRQHEHFEKLFAAARRWGFDQLDLRHISFGTVLGNDGQPFKTRAGDTVGLKGLLDEAVERAAAVVDASGQTFSPPQRLRIAEVVGIGGLKYADLSQNRTSDYKFSYEKMLALKGNTATYLQYSYARVRGVFAKGGVDPEAWRSEPAPFDLTHPVERQLALKLARFEETLHEVLVDFKPNLLTNYLFDLTQTFFEFYEQCRVLEAESAALRASRLQLCDLMARTVRCGLELLGIEVVEQM